jgi:hypothetical protein
MAFQKGHVDTSEADNRLELEAQLLMPRYFINKGKIWVEAKDEIRKRLGRSPDNADALIYSTYQSKSAGIARIASGRNATLLGGKRSPSMTTGGAGSLVPRLINTGRR